MKVTLTHEGATHDRMRELLDWALQAGNGCTMQELIDRLRASGAPHTYPWTIRFWLNTERPWRSKALKRLFAVLGMELVFVDQ